VTRIEFQPVGGYLGAAAAGAVLLLLLLMIRPLLAQTGRHRAAVLLAIRAGVYALTFAALLRPVVVVSEIKKQSASLVFLLDSSRSMLVADAFGGRSRWDALRGALNSARTQLESLAQHLDVKLYTFDSEPRVLPWKPGISPGESSGPELDESPRGEQSALGHALEEVLRHEAGRRLAGIVVLSDGAQRALAPRDTPPQYAARRLAELGCPLYTLVFGEARGLGQARDLALGDLLTSPTIYAKNQLEVRGTLRADGYSGRPLTVQLLFETSPGTMEVVAARQIVAEADGKEIPVALDYAPLHAGEFKLTLRAVAEEGELVQTNNELSTFVSVLKGGIRVLYLEGQLRAEQRFLRAALDAAPEVELDFWIDRGPTDRWPLDIRGDVELESFDVYLIGDLDSSVLSRDNWQTIADRVEAGAGLMMIGGFYSFGPGGYGSTPLADVLPITMDRLERQRFGEPIRDDVHRPGPLAMRPAAPFGLNHPALRLAPGDDLAATWQSLPPLEGANRFLGLKPSAVRLLESAGPESLPLLVAGNYGAGRVLAFAGDSTWHWPMEGFQAEHKRFWRQQVLWLARKDQSSEGEVWVSVEPRRYRPASRVEFTAGARSPAGEVVTGARWECEVVLPSGEKRRLPLTRRGSDQLGTMVDTDQPGDYSITARAFEGESPLGEASARFLVYRQDLELDNPSADPGLLASLASVTAPSGGLALAPEELPALLERILKTPHDLEVEIQARKTYWDRWPFLIAFVALLSADWYLRKRWGLV
jgi:uncharacterized membrane protein